MLNIEHFYIPGIIGNSLRAPDHGALQFACRQIATYPTTFASTSGALAQARLSGCDGKQHFDH
jgi:hypothetical protein